MLDRSLFEAFVDGGARSATVSFYPTQPLTQMTLGTADILEEMTVSVAVYALESGWASEADEDGTVRGNVTDSSTSGSGRMRRRGLVYEASF